MPVDPTRLSIAMYDTLNLARQTARSAHLLVIGADNIRPTDAGHAYMAEKIAPLIRSQLAIPL